MGSARVFVRRLDQIERWRLCSCMVCRSGLSFPHQFLGAQLNWLAAGIGEVVLGFLLLLGYKGRFAALGLIYITYVAVYTVHFDLGWAGWRAIETDEGLGFKVPLMLGLMLFAVLTQGPGRFSLDAAQASMSPKSNQGASKRVSST